MTKRPELSWKLNDYKNANIEPPEILSKNPNKSEGELMSDQEVQAWFLDSYKALTALKETNEDLFEELKQNFITDLWYLCEIEVLEEDAVIEILEDSLMK